jgi:hypothetical protein
MSGTTYGVGQMCAVEVLYMVVQGKSKAYRYSESCDVGVDTYGEYLAIGWNLIRASIFV